MKPIGVDPGFGNFKAAAVTDQGIRVAVVPSVVGVGETDLGLLSLGDLGKRRGPVPDRVEFGGVAYLVGPNVARYARPVQRMDLHRLTEGPQLRALFYATLHRLGLEDRALSMIVGLPVEVMADRELAMEVVAGMRRWMVGEHRFAVNGQEVVLEVVAVRAMAQPVGAFFAWGLDDAGRGARSKEDLRAPVAVCDIGFNTLDLFAVQGGEVVGRFTAGDTAGVRRAAERLIEAVQARYGVDLSLQEADAYLRAPDTPLYLPGGHTNIRALVRQALDAAAAEIVSFVERRWGNGRQFAHVLFTGGGATLLQSALLRQYPHGMVLPDPVTANAIGLARYAVRVFRE